MDNLRSRQLVERQWNPFRQLGREQIMAETLVTRSVAAAAAVDAADVAAAADAGAVAVLDDRLSA